MQRWWCTTLRVLDQECPVLPVPSGETLTVADESLNAGKCYRRGNDAMEKKNWHQARLIDLTGMPYDEKNVAKDAFEKQAAKQLAAGKDAYVEQIETTGGVRYLRAATAVPVVMKECTMCHPHFKDAKPGQAIGAVTYRLKIE